ncbi:hypothetical protein DV736_g6129, partial [Chaetothyriales sp. CBS 134916]
MGENTSISLSPALLAALPPPAKGEILTPQQWKTLLALCEPSFPALPAATTPEHNRVVATLEAYAPPDAGRDVINAYLAESAIELPRFKEGLRRVLAQTLPKQQVNDLKFILNALNSTAGCLLLTSHKAPFADQPLDVRSLILAHWSTSYLPLLRNLYRTFNGLTKKVWATVSPTISPVLGYHLAPDTLERTDSYDFEFHDFSAADAPTTLSTDVVIIGSGCGAGVVASHLSRAGLKVLVLEKSYHYSAALFPMPAAEGAENLFESGGTLTSEDGSMVVVAGSAFGGGGTINWSASLQPSAHVRNEWIHNHGLTQLAAPEFQDCLDYICERMGVAKSTDAASLAKIPHNFTNRALLEGARQLGLSTMIVPQNTKGKDHWCGSCSYGCSSCTKQGPANNWLPDAASHGAEFIEGCFVENILWSPTDRSQASGVLCTWTSRDQTITKSITINAPRVIVSSGALHSPLILHRSGLTNRHIGKNLHLHPVASIFATWPERSNPWEGPILTAAVTAFNTLDGLRPGGHGPVIECLCATPAFSALFRPFRTALITKKDPLGAARDWKERAAKWSHGSGFIAIQRDRDSGSVFADPDNPRLARLKYNTSYRDRVGIATGHIVAARIAYVQGADEIDSLIPEVPPFVRTKTVGSGPTSSPDDQQGLKAINDQAFEAWVKQVESKGNRDSGVVDPRGKVWGTQNVWVADASIFPTASGVNPMVTTMGLAEWIARGIVREVKANGRSKL